MVWAASLDSNNGSSANALSGVTGRAALSLKSLRRANDPITACQMSECGDGNKSVAYREHQKHNEANHGIVAQPALRL